MPPVDEDFAEIDVEALAAWIRAADSPLVIDVREPDEHAAGVLLNARLLPLGGIDGWIDGFPARPDRAIVVYCAAGSRSAEAARRLRNRGCRRVHSLRGGIEAWRRRGEPLCAPGELGSQALGTPQFDRYARQLRLPEVGIEGQEKLLRARVLCIGAGGIGSSACLYLAAAGVGQIAIVDDDVVAASNLQRQILHTTPRIGMLKTDSAARAIGELNPDVRVRLHPARLGAGNALDLLADCDVVVDGSDNFATRYLVNDAALRLGKPLVFGAVLRYEAQLAVFTGAPCYRCLFPSPAPAEFAPSCAEAGVLGVVPGLVGVLQAAEALKLILGIGATPAGQLVTFDAWTMDFGKLAIRANPECPVCAPGVDRSRLELRDDVPPRPATQPGCVP